MPIRLLTVLASILASMLFVSPAHGSTNVGGPITSNTTWTTAGSPYIVVSTITIRANATLTINPGVEVWFNANLGMIIGHATLGAGTLKAIGTVAQPITFTSSTVPGAAGQWKDINFTDYSTDAAFDGGGAYLSGCVLEHCVIEFGGGGATGTGSVTISQSSPFINYCEIRNGSRSGIWATNSTQPALKITHCNIHNIISNDQGAGANLSTQNLDFSNNIVQSNSTVGGAGGGLYLILLGTGSIATVSGNTISANQSGNGGGIYLQLSMSNATFLFSGNSLSNNTTGGGGGGMYVANYSSNSVLTISNNTYTGNHAAYGGGLAAYTNSNTSPWNFSSNTFVSNVAPYGGAVYMDGEFVATFAENTILSNQAIGSNGGSGYGGGIYVSHNASNTVNIIFTHNTFAGNSAAGSVSGGAGYGGGMYVTESNPGSQTIVNLAGNPGTNSYNTFSGNAATFGNAIYNNMSYNRNGSNDIFAQYVCWGGEDPNPVASPNLIFDVYDDSSKSEVIADGYVTDPNCGAAQIPLQSPVANPTVTQGYAIFNDIGNNKYHTGLDLVSSTNDLHIRAAAAGVAHIIPNESYCSPLCACNNYCLGNAVIIDHVSALGIYTFYGHLASISVSEDQSVAAGDEIGIMGNSGTTSVHLHFEVKHFRGLGNISNTGTDWGYTLGHPNLYGYMNPNPYLDLGVNTFVPQGVTATSTEVKTGPVPADYTQVVTTLSAGQKFAAFATYNGWYEVYLPSTNGPATGWIQATPDPQANVVLVDDQVSGNNGSVNVRSAPAVGAGNLISKVWDRQSLVRLSTAASGSGCSQQWYEVSVADNASGGGDSGWVCSAYLDAQQPGDINGDDVVNVDDLLAVINGWGPCPAPPASCAADANSDGVVNVDDLLMVINNWG